VSLAPLRIPPGVPLVSRTETAKLLKAQRAARRRVRKAGQYVLDKPVPKVSHD